MQNPPIKPISREHQLQLQLEVVSGQLGQMMGVRAKSSKLTLGEVMDGIGFTLQTAQGSDPEESAVAKQDLNNLKKLLEKVLSGDWTSPVSRIAIPR
jgi:hypothetical protein